MSHEISNEILEQPISYFVSKWVIERVPFIFNNNLDLYIAWKEQLSRLIGVDSKAITLTGSAAVGYSLSPAKELRAFNDSSDIDVAIISSHYFDVSWHYLRNIDTKIYKMDPKIRNSIQDHQSRLIYWGTIATDKIIQILPFGKEWIKAMNEMSKQDPTKNRDINFRIYKDFEALKAYQIVGIGKLKDELLKK